MENQVINVNVFAMSQQNKTTSIINANISLIDSSNSWLNALVNIQQSDSKTITIQLTINGNQVTQSFSDLELYIYNTTLWYLGDVNKKNTLSGFYYILIVSNFISQTSLDDPL